MALKFKDNPYKLSIGEADRLRARYDPYRLVSRNFKRGNYWKLSQILKKRENARHVAAIPTALLLLEGINYANLAKEMKNRGALREFIFCVDIAKRLATDFDSNLPSGLEELISQKSRKDIGISAFSYKEFKDFYERYYLHGNRSTST